MSVPGMEMAPSIAFMVLEELTGAMGQVSAKQCEALLDAICEAKEIFIAGSGRSLLVMRCFAMRLMHLGYKVHVVGETTTPAIQEKDLLIIGSGSGKTSSVVRFSEKAKKVGAKLAVFSIFADAPIVENADIFVKIPGVTAKNTGNNKNSSIQIGGNCFEQCLLILGDALIMRLAVRENIVMDDAAIMRRHANLE